MRSDDEIDGMLRDLPREHPAGLSGRVLRRVPRRKQARALPVLAAALALAIVGWRLVPRAPRSDQIGAELAAVRAERARLRAELESLRQKARPVIYLGGDEQQDLLLQSASRAERGE